jgi:hypothetical protein
MLCCVITNGVSVCLATHVYCLACLSVHKTHTYLFHQTSTPNFNFCTKK